MTPRARRVPSSNGIGLHVRDWGGDGMPCLLLHGIGLDAQVWDDVAVHAAPLCRVLALDFPGHGESDWDALRR